jgi:hypothetical protein
MAYEFFEGYAAVTVGRRQGYIDTAGEIVVPATYLYAREFSEGLAAVNTGTGAPHDSVASACEIGFINREGEFAIPPRFLAAGTFRGGLCLVETEKEIAYIDRCGNSIWSGGWAEIGNFDPIHLFPPGS